MKIKAVSKEKEVRTVFHFPTEGTDYLLIPLPLPGNGRETNAGGNTELASLCFCFLGVGVLNPWG